MPLATAQITITDLNDGSTGMTGRSIISIDEYYLASSSASGVTRSTSGWTSTMQQTSPTNKYLWNYERINWSMSPFTSYVEPIIVGVHGEPGPQGARGEQGPNIVDSKTYIEANVIKTNHLDVGELSAITANLGTVEAGTIMGVEIIGVNITGASIETEEWVNGTAKSTVKMQYHNLTATTIDGSTRSIAVVTPGTLGLQREVNSVVTHSVSLDYGGVDVAQYTSTGVLEAFGTLQVSNGKALLAVNDVSTDEIGARTNNLTIHAYANGIIRVLNNVAMNSKEINGVSKITSNGSDAFATFSLLNGWQVYGGNYFYPAYRKNVMGEVLLRGVAKGGTNGSFGVLPVGCRPSYEIAFPINCGSGYQMGWFKVMPSGQMEIYVPSGANSWAPLDGITFLAG